jgi:hypothetical protein
VANINESKMKTTPSPSLADSIKRLEFAFDSQRLENEPLLPEEKDRLRNMLTQGMSPEDGVNFLMRQLGACRTLP